jgi:hypothetical protein
MADYGVCQNNWPDSCGPKSCDDFGEAIGMRQQLNRQTAFSAESLNHWKSKASFSVEDRLNGIRQLLTFPKGSYIELLSPQYGTQ